MARRRRDAAVGGHAGSTSTPRSSSSRWTHNINDEAFADAIFELFMKQWVARSEQLVPVG